MASSQTGWRRPTFVGDEPSKYALFERILSEMRERFRGEGKAALAAWNKWLAPYSNLVLIHEHWNFAVPMRMRGHLIAEVKAWFEYVGANHALYSSPTHLPLLSNKKAWPLMSYLTKHGVLHPIESTGPPAKPAFFVRNPDTGVEVLYGPGGKVIEEMTPVNGGYRVVIPLSPSPPGGSPAHQPGARSPPEEWDPEYDDFFDNMDKDASHSPHSLAHVRVPFGRRQQAIYRMVQPRLR